jgi:hypothetical protein
MLVDFVRHAAEAKDRIGSHFWTHLRAGLGAAAGASLAARPRFERSIAMLAGKGQVYTQQPRDYYFAELPQLQSLPRDAAAWLDPVEAAADEIYAELSAVIRRVATGDLGAGASCGDRVAGGDGRVREWSARRMDRLTGITTYER